MKKSQSDQLMIKKILSYCPSCCEEKKAPRPKKTNDSIIVIQECPEHKPEFEMAKNGVMVSKNFVDSFNEMNKRVSLSSQRI